MGASVSFFSATQAQLEAAAPGWIKPRWGPFVAKDEYNPFTRTTTRIKRHECLSQPPLSCPPDTLHELIDAEHTWRWRSLPELTTLMPLITAASEEEIGKLHRPALLGPKNADYLVNEVPEILVLALAKLTAKDIDDVAKRWQTKAALPQAPTDFLAGLVQVATTANAQQLCVFEYVRLA